MHSMLFPVIRLIITTLGVHGQVIKQDLNPTQVTLRNIPYVDNPTMDSLTDTFCRLDMQYPLKKAMRLSFGFLVEI